MSRTPYAVLIVSVALLAVAGARFGGRVLGSGESADPRTVTSRAVLSPNEQSIISLFERCSKSVAYVRPRFTRMQRDIFGYLDATEATGTGSGFVWDKEGHIVTNYHVVQGANGCLVRLADEDEEYEAELTGVYPEKDIAVLHINAPKEKLQPIDVGVSRDLQVGQTVLAIGNPYGYDFSLTTGVVSALHRQIRSVANRTIQGVIQTDAAINPGNSGGPLLDSAGRLIGMNTQIVTPSGAYAGIGFAIPVDTINRIAPQLIANGRIIRPGLGVSIHGGISKDLGGVAVIGVVKDSGAYEAGLQPATLNRQGRIELGDVVTAIAGAPTPDEDALFNALERYKVGDTVEVTILRKNKKIEVPITLQAIE